MTRPCFLVIDREFPGSISTRKLVLETAKFNVITAYSGREALETARRFPALDGIVMDGELEDISSDELARSIKQMLPGIPVVVICPPGGRLHPDADFRVDSFQPAQLLETLRGLKLMESEEIARRDEALNREQR